MVERMGVYVFRSRETPWIKVGHHRVTPRRPDVSFRVARRGFHSCVHPPELEGRLDAKDFELVAWFPSLTRRDEGRLHRLCRTRYGEFHDASETEFVVSWCRQREGPARGGEEGEEASSFASSDIASPPLSAVAPPSSKRRRGGAAAGGGAAAEGGAAAAAGGGAAVVDGTAGKGRRGSQRGRASPPRAAAPRSSSKRRRGTRGEGEGRE